jgi:eukaryotic-like serine/threonine-protein kinase
MAQTTAAGGHYEPPAAGSGVPESPEQWGVGGMVGDGRYRMTRRLGRGGMAEVFAAEDVRLGRTVAVKLLRPDLAEDPVSKARFTREAQSVAGLNHHAIVAVYDSGEDETPNGTVSYMVMEIVEGRTIRELLNESPEPPPVDQALLIVAGVLDALAYSHQHGMVHRDIKPANVIITDAGAVKVMDFGIARALHGASQTMTQTGMVMGTPQYLSPEQALGKTVDTRSDLYATGCLLYELLALRPPFVGETPLSVVYQHVQDNPQLPSTISGRVPPELDGLVMRALAKDPDDRFQSAEEMRGVIHYAVDMLHRQGGFTGTWDTGAVAGTDRSTTALRVPPQQTGSYGRGVGTGTAEFTAGTAQQGPADTTVAYHPGHRGSGGGSGGRRWLKPVLFVVAAVIAVSLGVWLAVSSESGENPGGGRPTAPSASPTSDTSSAEPTDTATQPTEESSSDTTEPTYDPSQNQSTQTSSGPTTSPTPSNAPTSQPPKSPEPTPSQPQSSQDTSTTGGTSSSGGTSGDAGGEAGPTPPPPTSAP